MKAYSETSADVDDRSTWTWFFGLGLGFIVLSGFLFADLNAGASPTILTAGIVMLVAAVVQSAQSFQVRSWDGFTSWLLSSVLYGVAGVLFLTQAKASLHLVYLAIGVALFASAVARIWSSLEFRPGAYGAWISVSGAATLGASLVLIFVWPVEPVWLLGLGIAFDLLAQGVCATCLGLTLRGTRASRVVLTGAFESAPIIKGI